MTAFRKALDRILRGASDANADFDELCGILKQIGCEERIRGIPNNHLMLLVLRCS